MAIPMDPVILLSYINTQLRDKYSSLDALCDDMRLEKSDILQRLAGVDYHYDERLNKFV